MLRQDQNEERSNSQLLTIDEAMKLAGNGRYEEIYKYLLYSYNFSNHKYQTSTKKRNYDVYENEDKYSDFKYELNHFIYSFVDYEKELIPHTHEFGKSHARTEFDQVKPKVIFEFY